MRGLRLVEPGRIELDEIPDPTIEAPTDAIIEVEASGLCGSDLHPYLGREPARAGVVAGHEAVGRVLEVGAAVHDVKPGDRVVVPFSTSCGDCRTCRDGLTARCLNGQLFGWGDPDDLDAPALHGGQAERLRVPLATGTLVRIDEELDAATAVLLTDNVPTAWEALDRAGVGRGSHLVVSGLGPVGLCAVALAKARGAALILGVDPVATRRDAAAGLGAEVVAPSDLLEHVTGLGSGAQIDAVVEASGTDAGQRAAAEVVRPGGMLSLIAVPTSPAFTVTPTVAYDRNLTLRAGRASSRRVLDAVLPAVLAGTVDVPAAAVVTHVDRPLDEGPALYRAFAEREPGLVKATFRP